MLYSIYGVQTCDIVQEVVSFFMYIRILVLRNKFTGTGPGTRHNYGCGNAGGICTHNAGIRQRAELLATLIAQATDARVRIDLPAGERTIDHCAKSCVSLYGRHSGVLPVHHMIV